MKKIILTILFATFFWALSSEVLAAIQLDSSLRPENLPDINVQSATDTDNPETAATQTLILYVGNIVSQVLLFAAALTIVFIMIAGSKYVFSYGNEDRMNAGKKGMIWSVAGLIVIMLSYSIVRGLIKVLLSVDSTAS